MKKIKIESLKDLSELATAITLLILSLTCIMLMIFLFKAVTTEAKTIDPVKYECDELIEVSHDWSQVPYCAELWDIQRTCEEKGYNDYILAFSIARLETGNFTSKAYLDGNWGGLSYNEVPKDYDGDLYKGLEEFINLLVKYQEQGLTTAEDIGKKYCPVNYEHWVSTVNAIQSEVKGQLERSIIWA